MFPELGSQIESADSTHIYYNQKTGVAEIDGTKYDVNDYRTESEKEKDNPLKEDNASDTSPLMSAEELRLQMVALTIQANPGNVIDGTYIVDQAAILEAYVLGGVTPALPGEEGPEARQDGTQAPA